MLGGFEVGSQVYLAYHGYQDTCHGESEVDVYDINRITLLVYENIVSSTACLVPPRYIKDALPVAH